MKKLIFHIIIVAVGGVFVAVLVSAQSPGGPPQAGPPSGGGWTNDGTIVRLTADSDFVGIGTTTPSQKLSVHGNALISGNIQLTNLIGCNGINVLETSASGMIQCGLDDSGGGVSGWTDDGAVVRLTTGSDFVGIGTTTPSSTLSVQGNGLFSGDLLSANTIITGTVTTTQLYVSGTNGVGAGGIAIGTTTFGGGIRTADDIVLDLGISVYFDTNGDSGIQGISDSDGVGLRFATLANSIFLTGAGRVGIATSTPSQQLSVQGNALIFGTLQVIDNESSTFYVGDNTHSGCMVMGDSDGNGVTYVTANDGVLSATSVKPSICQ